MKLYSLQGESMLNPIKEIAFKLEKEIQTITEKNLSEIFKIEFVKSEFAINNFRIDSLAYDTESNSFVIIEYKRDKNYSVIDQGYAYLSLMLNNKADFILEYNESSKRTLKRDDIDWSQSRVVFISPQFTNYQREAINFKDLPIELWEIKKFSDDTIIYNQIETHGTQESVKTISRKDEQAKKVNKEIIVYTEEEHIERGSPETIELYEEVKQGVLNLGQITVKAKKKYIAFVSGTNVVDFRIQRKAIKLWINLKKGELDDPKGLMRDVSLIGHWGNGDYEIQISDTENYEYLLSLIKQSYQKNGK